MIKNAIIYTAIFPLFFISLHSTHAAPLGFLKIFVATKHENCAKGLPTHHPQFCSVFKAVAECHCTSSGLSKRKCQDIAALHDRMLSVFDTQLKACEYQQDTSTRNCMDSWNCYRLGGKDSQGRLCSGTGKACMG